MIDFWIIILKYKVELITNYLNELIMNYKITTGLTRRTQSFMNSVLDSVEGIENIDEGALRMLEYNYETFIRESDRLNNESVVITNVQGNLVTNPRVKVVKDAQTQCLAFLKEFGLTLKSRNTVKSQVKDQEESPLETFIKGKKEVR